MLIRHRGWIGRQWKSKGGRLRSGVRPWCFLALPSQETEKELLAFSCILLVYLLHEECGHGLEHTPQSSRLWTRKGFGDGT